jgi:hypothetical protein
VVAAHHGVERRDEEDEMRESIVLIHGEKMASSSRRERIKNGLVGACLVEEKVKEEIKRERQKPRWNQVLPLTDSHATQAVSHTWR